MAVTEAFTGTKLVSTTEWSLVNASSTLATNTTAGVYQLFLDLSGLVKADQFRIRVYEKVRSADTQRSVWTAVVANAQTDPIWVSPAITLMNGWDMSLLKLSGADETITWSIRKVG